MDQDSIECQALDLASTILGTLLETNATPFGMQALAPIVTSAVRSQMPDLDPDVHIAIEPNVYPKPGDRAWSGTLSARRGQTVLCQMTVVDGGIVR